MNTPALRTLTLGSLVAVFTAGCATSSSGLKAKTVPTSAFLDKGAALRPHRQREPFNAVWVNPKLEAVRGNYRGIYIAPVTTQYLRAVDRPLVTALEGPKALRAGKPALRYCPCRCAMIRSRIFCGFGTPSIRSVPSAEAAVEMVMSPMPTMRPIRL